MSRVSRSMPTARFSYNQKKEWLFLSFVSSSLFLLRKIAAYKAGIFFIPFSASRFCHVKIKRALENKLSNKKTGAPLPEATNSKMIKTRMFVRMYRVRQNRNSPLIIAIVSFSQTIRMKKETTSNSHRSIVTKRHVEHLDATIRVAINVCPTFG